VAWLRSPRPRRGPSRAPRLRIVREGGGARVPRLRIICAVLSDEPGPVVLRESAAFLRPPITLGRGAPPWQRIEVHDCRRWYPDGHVRRC
jgi:hypothetical protein